jgi:hypothetical protein
MRNADLIRAGRLSEIDADHIGEKLESMGRSERFESSLIFPPSLMSSNSPGTKLAILIALRLASNG